MAVTEDNTNLRRRSTLPGELADLVNDLLGGGLEPGRGGTRVGDGRARNALSLAVKTTHFDLFARVMKLVVVLLLSTTVVAEQKWLKFAIIFLWSGGVWIT